MIGSGCWELKKAERKVIERFNAKALKWICGNMNNIDSVFSTNLLPPLCYKVLKDFLLYSNIINGYYAVQLTEHYEINREGRHKNITTVNEKGTRHFGDKVSPKRLFKGWAETYTWRLQHSLSGDLVLYTSIERYHLESTKRASNMSQFLLMPRVAWDRLCSHLAKRGRTGAKT